MWKQSTIFGFIAGTLISLSLQALTAMGLFEVEDAPPRRNADIESASGAGTPPNQAQDADVEQVVAIGEHLTFSPFVLLSAVLFFSSGIIFFILSNASQRLNIELASVISPSMTIEEKDELEEAVLKSRKRYFTSLGVAAVLTGLIAFAVLVFRPS